MAELAKETLLTASTASKSRLAEPRIALASASSDSLRPFRSLPPSSLRAKQQDSFRRTDAIAASSHSNTHTHNRCRVCSVRVPCVFFGHRWKSSTKSLRALARPLCCLHCLHTTHTSHRSSSLLTAPRPLRAHAHNTHSTDRAEHRSALDLGVTLPASRGISQGPNGPAAGLCTQHGHQHVITCLAC